MSITERINNTAIMLDIPEAMKKLKDMRKNGIPKGISVGWPKFDKYYTIPPVGQLNVLTGFPGSGKSEWLDSVALNLAVANNWRIFYYSPENYPSEYHLQKLCEKFADKPFFGRWMKEDGRSLRTNVNDDEIDLFHKLIEKNFAFIDCHINNATIEKVINSIFDECIDKKIDMAIVDPWNKLESQKPPNMSETEFVGSCLTRMQMFARENKIQFWVVAHPAKPMKKKDGSFSALSLYDISGSAHWYNMVDNGFIVHRSWDDKVGNTNLNKLVIAKIKDRRYGKCGETTFRFDPASGNYDFMDP